MMKDKKGWIWGVVLFILYSIVWVNIKVYSVDGLSMAPTLDDGERMVISKVSDIERMDIILFRMNEAHVFVKRVIGLPGDEIRYEEGVLQVNGERIQEAYVKHWENEVGWEMRGSLEDWTGYWEVPEDSLFVMGDNRVSSVDSRHFGFIKASQVMGVYWVSL